MATDLQVDSKTIKSWLEILENLFIIFKITPFHKNIARSLLKDSKYYFYDTAKVSHDSGTAFENHVALALKKQLAFLKNSQGIKSKLHFLRTKDKKEIDFFIQFEQGKQIMLECKSSDTSLSKNFKLFKRFLPQAQCIQLVLNTKENKSHSTGEKVYAALPWLCEMKF